MARPRLRTHQTSAHRHAPWKVNRAAANQAIEMLGLRKPVAFRWKEAYTGPFFPSLFTCLGFYDQTPKRHLVYLDRLLMPQRANEVVWHELGHAYQAERRSGVWEYRPDGTPVRLIVDPYDGVKPLSEKQPRSMNADYWQYFRAANEVHAREVAAEFAPLLNLILLESDCR